MTYVVRGAVPPKSIRIGATLFQSFLLLRRHPALFGGLAVLFGLAFFLFETVFFRGLFRYVRDLSLIPIFVWPRMAYMSLQFILSAVIARVAFLSLQGKGVSLAGVLQAGFRHLLTVLGVTVLSVPAISAGFVLFIIPGFIVKAMLFVAVPAAAIESTGVLPSLRRSLRLTRGSRFKIFGVLVLLAILDTASGPLLSRLLISSGHASFLYRFHKLMNVGVFGLATSLLSAVVYFRLRAAREGPDTTQVAAVFD